MADINKKISKILLVDDDEVSNFYHEYLLRDKLNFEGELPVCLNGKEALNYIANSNPFSGEENNYSTPDLVLLDINMPVMDGFEFMEEFAKIKDEVKCRIVICMLTSSLNYQDRIKILEIGGIDHFMNKPLKEERLFEIINEEFL